MSEKELFPTPEEGPFFKAPLLGEPIKKAKGPAESIPYTIVRTSSEIPQSILDYFQFNTRSRIPLQPAERILHSQVYLHEIEEGARLLRRAGQDKEAAILADFGNQLHPSQRLDMLRKRLEETKLLKSSPERIQRSHKARGNQWGAIKARLGNHPAVAFTELGVGYKTVNEDAFLVMPAQKVLALSDGLGGHPGGEVASAVAVDFFEYGIYQGLSLEESIALANEALLIRSASDPRLGGMYPMACTFAAVQLKHNLLRVAHVGDTKVLGLRHGEIFFETQDHTKGQELLRDRLIDATTALELNHLLSRCLGLDKIQAWRDVAIQQVTLHPGDRILLLTDGITDNFYDAKFSLDALIQLLEKGPMAQAADLLVEACHRRMSSAHLPNGRQSKPDNISLAMMEYRG
jgi:serine/threonine protein phosphatase PrpC